MAASLPPVIARSSGFLERFCYWLESKRRGESERVTFRFPSFPSQPPFPLFPTPTPKSVVGWLMMRKERVATLPLRQMNKAPNRPSQHFIEYSISILSHQFHLRDGNHVERFAIRIRNSTMNYECVRFVTRSSFATKIRFIIR